MPTAHEEWMGYLAEMWKIKGVSTFCCYECAVRRGTWNPVQERDGFTYLYPTISFKFRKVVYCPYCDIVLSSNIGPKGVQLSQHYRILENGDVEVCVPSRVNMRVVGARAL